MAKTMRALPAVAATIDAVWHMPDLMRCAALNITGITLQNEKQEHAASEVPSGTADHAK
jgi:hypothetical protein